MLYNGWHASHVIKTACLIFCCKYFQHPVLMIIVFWLGFYAKWLFDVDYSRCCISFNIIILVVTWMLLLNWKNKGCHSAFILYEWVLSLKRKNDRNWAKVSLSTILFSWSKLNELRDTASVQWHKKYISQKCQIFWINFLLNFESPFTFQVTLERHIVTACIPFLILNVFIWGGLLL